MMDFDRKNAIMQKIAQNGGMFHQMMMMQQQMLQMAQMLDQVKGTNMAQQLAAGMTGGPAPAGGNVEPQKMAVGDTGESSVTEKARKLVAESTSPT
jgi:hypothetical protein